VVVVTWTTGDGAAGPQRTSIVHVLPTDEDPTLVAAQQVAGRIKQQYAGAHAMVIASRYVE
jgi:hypothetical protein